ncbi:MAG: GTPase HflX [Phycisphaerales bacterium]|nr:GTPase HflX [Phycisphaerales bacterium]
MKDEARESIQIRDEAAIIVAVVLPDAEIDEEDPLAEIAALAEAAGVRVAGRLIQQRKAPRAKTYLGKGKVEELATMAKALKAKAVLFDNDLSPMQIRSLEEELSCKVLDRSELILDIFAARAATKEAKLAVEIAQLEYTAPRLRAMWSHLGQVTGGAPIGVGTRGPGEQQLEIDRRLVQRRLVQLKRNLQDVQARKSREVSSRRDGHFTVGLVGYTNAGKSTLFNQLTGGDTFEADMLFATLGTRVGAWNVGGGNSVVLSDTVGFIRSLPHHLVASFRATLEETIYAHVVLIVLDVADRNAARQLATVERVLDDIGAVDQPRLLVLNKVDRLRETVRTGLSPSEELAAWLEANPDAVAVSARTGEGLEDLSARMLTQVRGELREVAIQVPLAEAKLVDLIEKRTEVSDRNYDQSGEVVLRTTLGRRQLETFLASGARFRVEGMEPREALATLWATPQEPREPRIPPHLSLHPR